MSMSLTCSYQGDCSDFVVGQLMGPDNAGGYVEAVDAKYDPETGRTRVWFKPVLPNDQRYTMPDQWGFNRVVQE